MKKCAVIFSCASFGFVCVFAKENRGGADEEGGCGRGVIAPGRQGKDSRACEISFQR